MAFLKELKYSHHDMERIFTSGSCFRLCKILEPICPGAIFHYSDRDGHWVTEYDGRFYDINGEIDKEYIDYKKYLPQVEYRTLASAYIAKADGEGGSYSKYIESF